MSWLSALVFAAVCTGFWQFVAPDPTLVQQFSLMLLIAAAGVALLQKKVAARSLTFTEMVLYAATVVSVAISMCVGADAGIQFSAAFIVTLMALSILVRSLSTEQILNIGAMAILFMQVCSFAADSHEFVQSLSITVTDEGLLRFTPFRNHPNLIGFIFGAGTVLLARRAIAAPQLPERALFTVAAAAGWVMLFAASTRASLIALTLATILAILREVPWRRLIALAAVASLAVGVLFLTTSVGDKTMNYLSGILEINSSTRGVSSGGSGRTDLWELGINTLISDPLLFTLGGGLRSSDIANIGFSTEDSYVTILLDSGVFLGGGIIACYFYCFFISLSLTRSSATNRHQLALLPWFFVFILFESVFNRYLLGIGNPMSLLVLMLLISVSDRARIEAQPAAESSLSRGPSTHRPA